jgi:hypothetical protein
MPWIFVPYPQPPGVPDDDGTRPLKNAVTSYACPSILVNGAPYDGGPLPPGEVDLSLRVANLGSLGAWVTARFYLSDPATGFSPTDLLGSSEGFYVAANTSAAMAKQSPIAPQTIPEGKPHLCVFAHAWSSLDPATRPGDPIDDRHWGQQNLQIRTARPGERVVVPFLAVGRGDALRYTVNVRRHSTPDDRQQLVLPGAAVALRDGAGGHEPAEQLQLDLRAGERRPLELSVQVPQDASPGTRALLVLEQTPVGGAQPVGAIGVTIAVTA